MRKTLALLALAGIAGLSACGGGGYTREVHYVPSGQQQTTATPVQNNGLSNTSINNRNGGQGGLVTANNTYVSGARRQDVPRATQPNTGGSTYVPGARQAAPARTTTGGSTGGTYVPRRR